MSKNNIDDLKSTGAFSDGIIHAVSCVQAKNSAILKI